MDWIEIQMLLHITKKNLKGILMHYPGINYIDLILQIISNVPIYDTTE